MEFKTLAMASSLSVSMVAAGLAPMAAHAGGTIKIDDTKWINVGAGLRTSFETREDAAPNGNDRSNEFELESIRLYISGQIHEYIKFTFNTERNGNGEIRVLDGIAQFEFNDFVNVWMGRHLPPSDRSNLSGPYYLGTWNFPFVQQYPNIFAGRDDGVSLWGQVNGGMFKYQVGAYQGADGGSNDEDNLLYAGRLTFNMWDPEPGYYNSSTYYGAKDILAVGLVAMAQDDASGVAGNSDDFFGWNIDFLMEKKLGNNAVATLEAAYYDYDLDDRVFGGTTAGPTQGDGFFVLASYLLPTKIGIGRFQPQFRYQEFNADLGGVDTDQWELGLNYIIDGHNARLSLVWGERDQSNTSDNEDFVQFGVQLQI